MLCERCNYFVGLQLRLPYLAQQRKSPLPLLAILARADLSVVAHVVKLQLRFPQPAQQRKSPLPLLALFARNALPAL